MNRMPYLRKRSFAVGKKIAKIKLELYGDRFVQMLGDNKNSEFREAIVHVQPGETKEEAWARHLFDNPLDVNAIVKIFIVPSSINSG